MEAAETGFILGAILAISAALFSFELLTWTQVSLILSPLFAPIAIGLAILGQCLASASLTFSGVRKRVAGDLGSLAAITWVVPLFLMLSYVAGREIKEAINADVFRGLVENTPSLAHVYQLATLKWTPWLGLALLLPHFCFGLLLTGLFDRVERSSFHRAYCFDLSGAVIGCVLAYVSLEYAGYLPALAIPCVLAAASGACLLAREKRHRGRLALLVGVTAIVVGSIFVLGRDRLEPRPQVDMAARNYELRFKARELWSGWSSFTRSGIFELKAPDGSATYCLSHGNGESHGSILSLGDTHRDIRAGLVGALGVPKSVLVLFSGLGGDMIQLDGAFHGQTKFTSVELNSALLDGARTALPASYHLAEFFSLNRVSNYWNEGRTFLENDPDRYDVILISHSGATWAYQAGAMGPTTQTLFTVEALRALFRHLHPGGLVVMLNPSTLNFVDGVRQVLDERTPEAARKAVVLVTFPMGGQNRDVSPRQTDLLLKPDGFSPDEVQKVEAAVLPWNASVAYAPDRPVTKERSAEEIRLILENSDREGAIRELEAAEHRRFSTATDDRPFAFDSFLPADYLRPSFWRQVFSPVADGQYNHVMVLAFVLLLGLFGLILLGVAFSNKKVFLRRSCLKVTHYFAVLGFGFMCIELGLLWKLIPIIGNPGLGMAIVLGSLVFFTGLGSLAGLSARHARWVLALLAWGTILLVIGKQIPVWTLPHALPIRIGVVLVVTLPAGLILGGFFPAGLAWARAQHRELLPWAWAINGMSSVLASIFAPLLARAVGISWVIALGLGVYLTILRGLPERQKGVAN